MSSESHVQNDPQVLMMNLKDDPAAIETYRRYHRDVWPEVLQSLRQVGVRHMDIHLLGRRVVMIVEMDDGLDYRVGLQSARLLQRARRRVGASDEKPAGACRGAPERTSGGLSWSPFFTWISRSRPLPASPNRLVSPDAGLLTDLRQSWSVPSRPRPIVIIGAGGVVRTAHLPVYQRLKFPVAGLFDIKSRSLARNRAGDFGVSQRVCLAG